MNDLASASLELEKAIAGFLEDMKNRIRNNMNPTGYVDDDGVVVFPVGCGAIYRLSEARARLSECLKQMQSKSPANERDLLIEALRVVNRCSGTLNEISAQVSRLNLSEDHTLHALLRRQFKEDSGVGLFIAARNLKIELPDDLKGEAEDAE